MAVWDALQTDSTIADSIPMLREFRGMAVNSRYKWLSDIANEVAAGNYGTATALLGYDMNSLTNTATGAVTGVAMMDGSGANYVVQNYLDIYRYSIKYAMDALTDDEAADVLTIANLCPDIDGKIVFAARGLYFRISGQVLEPDDKCLGGDTVYNRIIQPTHGIVKNINELTKANQGYTMQPNPNNGNLTITQKWADNSVVKVQVYNATGMVVLNSTLQFINGVAGIHIQNNSPGVYMLKLSDDLGNSFISKFVIQ